MTTSISPQKKLLYAMVPPLLLVLLAFTAGEILLRQQYSNVESITGATEWKLDRWGELAYYWDEYDPLLGWSNLPGYRSDAKVPFRVTINDQGLRARTNFSDEASPGTKRIALFGDSCAFGEEVNDGQTVSAHLQRQLENTEVLNYGVHGYGLGQMVLRMEREGFDLHPDHIVLLLLLPSDVTRDPKDFYCHNKPVFGTQDGELVVSNIPVPEKSRQPWVLRHSYCLAWLFGRPEETTLPEEVRGFLRITGVLLKKARALCEANGVELTVCTVVVPGTIDKMVHDPDGERELIQRMVKHIQATKVDLLDEVGYLEDEHQARPGKLAAPRGHWNALGNCIIARRLAEHLSEQGGSFVQREGDC